MPATAGMHTSASGITRQALRSAPFLLTRSALAPTASVRGLRRPPRARAAPGSWWTRGARRRSCRPLGLCPPQPRADFLQFLQRMEGPAQPAFLVCRREGGALVGVINLTNVILGAFRSG